MNVQAIGSASRRAAVFVVASALVACAGMAGTPARVADGALTDTAGKSLYTFDRDVAASGKSACNGPCAANWPAFTAPAGATASAGWSIVTRDDGTKQWALRGQPLYTFAKDAKPGDRTGDGFNGGVWHLARP